MIHIIRRRVLTRFTISTTKTVFNELSNVLRRGRSLSTVSVPSEINIPKPQKGRKKVSRDERRALVESYVNKYREAHAGKFPSFSDTNKQVGGSYYVIRKIIQELEHNSKISSSNSGQEGLLGKEVTKESESLTEVEKLSTRGGQVDMQTEYHPHTVALNDVEVPDTNDKYRQVEEGLHTPENMMLDEDGQSVHVATQNNLLEGDAKDLPHPFAGKLYEFKVEEAQSDQSNFVVAESNILRREIDDQCSEKQEDHKLVKAEGSGSHFVATEDHLEESETKNISRPSREKVEVDQQAHPASEDLMDTNGPKQKKRYPEQEKYTKDMSSWQTNDTEPPSKSTLWGNLKSFVDGLINIWRKL